MSEQTQATEQNTITLISNVGALGSNMSALWDVSAGLSGLMSIMSSVNTSLNHLIISSTNQSQSMVDALLQNSSTTQGIADSYRAMIGSRLGGGGKGGGSAGGLDVKSQMGSLLGDVFKPISNMIAPKGNTAGGLASTLGGAAYDATLGKVPIFGKMGKAGFKAGSKMFGMMAQTFTEMGPQMATLKLVIEPMMAMINGILAPFSILTDIFGLYGELLGTAFIPIIVQLMPIFLSLIPIVMLFARMIASLTPLMGFLIVPLHLLANVILMTVPLLDLFVSSMEMVSAVFQAPIDVLNAIGDTFRDGWLNFFSPIQDAVDWMQGATGTVEGFFGGVTDFFTGEGKHGEWWKR